MTNDQINAAVRNLIGTPKFVGLKKRGLWYRPGASGYTPCESEAGRFTWEEARKHEYPHDVPVTIHEFSPKDYASSLDACREFEDTLNPLEMTKYATTLRGLVIRDIVDERLLDPSTGRVPAGRFYCATPLQRCEAFCSIKGVWFYKDQK